jgi:hypothetical protein
MPDKTSIAEIEAETKRIQLETAQIELDEARERNQQWKANREVRSRLNRQRQGQLRADLTDRAEIIRTCTHRQGGSPGRERKGAGPSALRVVILPDERQLVMCANCPLRVFSPLPSLKNPEPFKGETRADAKDRVARYNRELEEFEKLVTLSQDQLTPEAAGAMHCGKTFNFIGRDGNNVIMPAPCDSYAQGRDNRQVG